MPFLTKIGDITIEQHEIKRKDGYPYLTVHASGIGVLHTTEGSNLSGALAAFEKNYDPPHFLVGENRIIQCRPLGARAASLRSNHYDSPNDNAQIQIEMVGFSQKKLWSPTPETLHGALLVMAYCSKHFGVPFNLQKTNGQMTSLTCGGRGRRTICEERQLRKVFGPGHKDGGCTWRYLGRTQAGIGTAVH